MSVCVSHGNRGKAGLLLKKGDTGLCQLWRQGTASESLELLQVQHYSLLPLVGAPNYPLRFHLYLPNRPSDLAGRLHPMSQGYEHVTQAWKSEKNHVTQISFCFGYSRTEEPIFL